MKNETNNRKGLDWKVALAGGVALGAGFGLAGIAGASGSSLVPDVIRLGDDAQVASAGSLAPKGSISESIVVNRIDSLPASASVGVSDPVSAMSPVERALSVASVASVADSIPSPASPAAPTADSAPSAFSLATVSAPSAASAGSDARPGRGDRPADAPNRGGDSAPSADSDDGRRPGRADRPAAAPAPAPDSAPSPASPASVGSAASGWSS